MCLYPRFTMNPKYKANKKNGGIIPAVEDKRVLYVPYGCGNCMECRKQKTREWTIRLMEDIKTHTNGKMLTLTFSDQHYKELAQEFKIEGYLLDNMIATLATRRFLERWRKQYKKSLRHWFVTELGQQNTENIHLHGIVWTDEKMTTIEQKWHYGFIHKGRYNIKTGQYINYVNAETINYTCKYVTKMDLIHQQYKPIILCSPGIGSQYAKTWNALTNKYNGTETNETYRTPAGYKMSLPIYWRNKIYNETERELLWLQRLDRNKRYVLGTEIDTSTTNGLHKYFKALEAARKINNELHYGTHQPNWKRQEYEHQIRIIKQNARLQHKTKDLEEAPF